MEQYRPKLGDAIVVVWKDENGTACGGTEGLVLGVTGNGVSGEYLVLDRSTYQDSFKSEMFSLGLLDLKVIPMKDAELIEKTDLRRRPPSSFEDFNLLMEADYRSNVDFDATLAKGIEKRTDCNVERTRRPGSEAEYGISIKAISAAEGASITISNKGTIQIFCKHNRLGDCVKWIQEAVELLPGHERLVLFPTKVQYRINSTYKEESHPTEEVINRIAMAEGGSSPIIFPIGWAHKFFVELNVNPLQGFFPGCEPLRDFVVKDKCREEDLLKYPVASDQAELKQLDDLQLSRNAANVIRFLGAHSSTIRLRSALESSAPEYVKFLIETWLGMRSAPWQWFSSGHLSGKMIVRDLNIDKKNRIWTLDLRRYSNYAE